MGYNPNIHHLYVGYNPFTNHLLNSWDILVGEHNSLGFSVFEAGTLVLNKGGTARGRSMDTQSVLDFGEFFFWLPKHFKGTLTYCKKWIALIISKLQPHK